MLLASLAAVSIATCAPLNPSFAKPVSSSTLQPGRPGADCRTRFPRRRGGAAAGDPVVSQAIYLGGGAAATRTYSEAALLLHTSATTGKPKLVPLSAANLSAMIDATCGALELSSDDRFLSMMPLFHLQGLLSCWAQWRAGGSVVVTAGFEAREFPSWIEEYRPTWYTAGPTLHRAMLSLTGDSFRPGRLRLVRSLGAPLHQTLLEQLEASLGIPVIEGYGLTEAGLLTSNPLRQRKPGSVAPAPAPKSPLSGARLWYEAPRYSPATPMIRRPIARLFARAGSKRRSRRHRLRGLSLRHGPHQGDD